MRKPCIGGTRVGLQGRLAQLRRAQLLSVALRPGLAAQTGFGQANVGTQAGDGQHQHRTDPGHAPQQQTPATRRICR